MPGILMPAPCATFMGCTLGFMGGPAKPPPLDAISGIHKWFSLYKSRKKLLLTPKNKQNKQKSRSRCQPNQLPERNAGGGLFGGLTDVGVRFRAPKLGLRFDRKKSPLSTKS